MDEERKEYLPHSSWCFLCGDENASGVQARFHVAGDAVRTRVRLPARFNGYRGVAHGGIAAALLDESMGWAATVFGKEHPMYVTGELTVKYLAPVPLEADIEIESRLVRDAGRMAIVEGELRSGGTVRVKAAGKFLPMSREDSDRVFSVLKYDHCRKYRTLRPGS